MKNQYLNKVSLMQKYFGFITYVILILLLSTLHSRALNYDKIQINNCDVLYVFGKDTDPLLFPVPFSTVALTCTTSTE